MMDKEKAQRIGELFLWAVIIVSFLGILFEGIGLFFAMMWS